MESLFPISEKDVWRQKGVIEYYGIISIYKKPTDIENRSLYWENDKAAVLRGNASNKYCDAIMQ